MPNKSNISGVTQIAGENCNMNVMNIHCNSVTVTNNDYTSSIPTNNPSLLSTIQNTKAFDDLQNFFQDTIDLPIERIFDVLKLPLLKKEDKEKREIFLKTHISHDNAFGILNLTCELNNLILRDITENFIVNNIKEITDKEIIPQISEDRLENIFKNNFDKLKIKDFFVIVKKWKDENAIERRKHFCRLMRTIWKKAFEINDMKFIAVDFTDELDGCESCVKISKEIIQKHFFSGTKSHLFYLIINPENKEFTSIKIFDHSKDYWHIHIDIQPSVRLSNNIIMNDSLILIGGCNIKGEKSNETFRFDMKLKRKLPMEFMNTKRIHFALAILGDNLYAIGGVNEKNELLSTVEVWNSITDKWMNVRDMNRKRYLHTALTLNGKIYVFGGYSFDCKIYLGYKSIDIYDGQKNNWTCIQYETEIISYVILRSNLALPIKDNIVFLDLNGKDVFELKIFYPSTEKVTYQSDVPKLKYYFDLIQLNEKIILFGDPKNYLYNLEEKSWTEFKTPLESSGYNTTFSYNYHV